MPGELEYVLVYQAPFSCPVCSVVKRRAVDIADHCRRVHGRRPLIYLCPACGRRGGVLSISVHRHYCRGIASTISSMNGHRCEYCSREFRGARGLNLHAKATHPTERSRALECRVARCKFRWSEEDRKLLALAEVTVRARIVHATGPTHLNVLILEEYRQMGGLRGRTVESVKAQRRLERHRVLVEELRGLVADGSRVEEAGGAMGLEQEGDSLSVGEDTGPADEEMLLASFLVDGGSYGLKSEFYEALRWAVSQRRVDEEFLGVSSRVLRRIPRRVPRITGGKSGVVVRGVGSLRAMFDRRARVALGYIINPSSGFCRVGIGRVRGEFQDRFSRPAMVSGDYDGLRGMEGLAKGVFRPIQEDEVQRALRKLPGLTAVGLDGVTAKGLKGVGAGLLSRIYSIWYFLGRVPPEYKRSRTVLIPKGGANLGDGLGGFRPISISSCMYRVFSSIVTGRLASQVRLDMSQRGFMRGESGLVVNSFLLKACIKNARAACRPILICFLDLSKAFDTIGHASIYRALVRQGVDYRLGKIVRGMLEGSSTEVWHAGESTGGIAILRGVKQGDPISPLLFNLVLDELLVNLNRQALGYRFRRGGEVVGRVVVSIRR